MAASTPDFVSELVQQMKSLTMETDEEILLDLALGHVSDAAAEKLGLKQGNKHCHYESYLKLEILPSYNYEANSSVPPDQGISPWIIRADKSCSHGLRGHHRHRDEPCQD